METYLGKGAGNAVSSIAKTANPNFADTVDFANERVGLLVSRLEQIASRLCGSVPQDAGGAVPQPVPNGLFDGVMSKAASISQMADAGLDMLNRIERSLP